MTTEEKLDAILEHVIKHKEKSPFSITEIKKSVLRDETEEYIEFLFKRIKCNKAAKVNIVSDPPLIFYDEKIEEFLKDGTFTERKQRKDRKEVHEENERRLTKFRLMAFWPVLVLSVIGGVDAIVGWVYRTSHATEVHETESMPQFELNESTEPAQTELRDSVEVIDAGSSKMK